jgi:hypothetical protein
MPTHNAQRNKQLADTRQQPSLKHRHLFLAQLRQESHLDGQKLLSSPLMTNAARLLAVLHLTLSVASALHPDVFDVRDYGAVGDGTTLNTLPFSKVAPIFLPMRHHVCPVILDPAKHRRLTQLLQTTRSEAAAALPLFPFHPVFT